MNPADLYFIAFHAVCITALVKFFWLRGYSGVPVVVIGLASILIMPFVPMLVLMIIELLAGRLGLLLGQQSDVWLNPMTLVLSISLVLFGLYRWACYWPAKRTNEESANKPWEIDA